LNTAADYPPVLFVKQKQIQKCSNPYSPWKAPTLPQAPSLQRTNEVPYWRNDDFVEEEARTLH